jgi:hypothetical protein
MSGSGKREEECIEDFGGKAIMNRPLGKPRQRWVDNTEMGGLNGLI